MANFRTHLSVAVAGGALLAVSGWHAALWSATDAGPLAALTAFGGILPDIDSDHSRSIRLIFTLFAVLAVVGGALLLQNRLSPGALVVACGGLYVGVRYAFGSVFKRFTVHRGIWHSLLAAMLCGLATTAVSYQLLQQSSWMAWAHGIALVIGTLIHLLLDEMYSVDLVGSRLKRSFGTAFKLFDYREPGNSVIMLMLAAGLAPWLPPWQVLVDLLSQGSRLWR
ncbi:metal-dependent hydrolase [Modicisalibacter xianhensis]|uniref:LexA-binding, inner membrane-associated putative hydrolase n=1 Tax=Modicisalibacter xianhensis TaxID=442341 RepID=A0A1I3EVG6_9GAMM|nr:metal-dependent hydrolase [Halomonas xianhensis]TDX25439.1 LexA-binding, inner membrane-associated putative hydrolase [Halomonas xianhensis]SFI02959.1 LexA-binding, inner membrane-associated putative hydrolase [Halomonas xianhensis]